ncbi:MAG: hypothetical protein KDB27_16955 [Planctomycetales bacterium]|nr:hypothetical protein [Planctomycetales bacterium]
MTEADQHQPEVFEAYWGRDQVDALFTDLERHAKVTHVQIRTLSDSQPRNSTVTLECAREMLDDSHVKAIQIHYEFDGDSWCDTLVLMPESIRIVRTTVPFDR